MSKKTILMLLSLTLMALILLAACQAGPPASSTSPATPGSRQTALEQPDQETFSQYFRKLAVGRLQAELVGSKDWHRQVEETNVLASGDSLVLQGEVVEEVNLSARYYDVQAGQFVGLENVGPQHPLKPGGFASNYTINLAPGEYEARCYVSDVLVAVLPFEVVDTLPAVAPSPTAAPEPSEVSEQPDESVFNEYFTDIGLGKIRPGGQVPQDLQRGISVFSTDDNVCLYGTVTQKVQPSVALYDVVGAQHVQSKQPLPRALEKGGFASCGGSLPVGKYEYRVYVGDVLVAVLPFEVE